MKKLKTVLKKILPTFLIRYLTGMFYGWYGNYNTWEEAGKKCIGYDSQIIFDKVKEATLQVKNGNAVFERDSVIFNKLEYNYPLISGLMWIAAKNHGKLNIIDFGGSLGSTYFQNKKFLDEIPEVNWNVVEQKTFVEIGKVNFKDDHLDFFYDIDECLENHEINVVLLSSVLQYLPNPYSLLEQLIKKQIEFIIIDRTGFIDKPDRITIQKVNPSIYKATYPCWFFNKNIFTNFMEQKYQLISSFKTDDNSNINSEFFGFIYKRKNILQ